MATTKKKKKAVKKVVTAENAAPVSEPQVVADLVPGEDVVLMAPISTESTLVVDVRSIVLSEKYGFRTPDTANPKYLEVMDSIKRHGIVVPLEVTPIDGRPGYYELFSGYNRLSIAKELGLPTVPVQVRNGDEAEIMSIALDLNDATVPMSVLDEARAVERASALLKTKSRRELSKRLGKSERWVSNHMDLVNLPDELQAAIATGSDIVSLEKCHDLLRLKPEDRPRYVKDLLVRTGPYFRAHLEKEVERGKAEWEGGQKAPKVAGPKASLQPKRGKVSAPEAEEGNNKAEDTTPRVHLAPLAPHGVKLLIAKAEKIVTAIEESAHNSENYDAFIASRALAYYEARGRISMGLAVLRLDPGAVSFDEALRVFEETTGAKHALDDRKDSSEAGSEASDWPKEDLR